MQELAIITQMNMKIRIYYNVLLFYYLFFRVNKLITVIN